MPDLPRLMYVAEVPVEASYHGSALVYRLLQQYPVDRLRIVECERPSDPARRLSGVHYDVVPYPGRRLARTRLHRAFTAGWTIRIPRLAARLNRIADAFKPEAILSVGHGYAWHPAWQLARRRDVPFHFIVHDDWPQMADGYRWAVARLQRQFAIVYQNAASRMCVSPFMIEQYQQRYGAAGSLLYPGRSLQVSRLADRASIDARRGGLRFAFAGTLNGDVIGLIEQLAERLTATGGPLLMYGPFNQADLQRRGLTAANVQARGLVAAEEIVATLCREADVLFLPLSFSDADRANMSVHFPSKLTDYTATGLPTLVYGPPYSSAVRWSQLYPDAVAAATTADELTAAVERLHDPKHRQQLGQTAAAIGDQLFDHAAVQQQFYARLRRKSK